jgi:corrinoid protein of di/trimethylamine methyltransferase
VTKEDVMLERLRDSIVELEIDTVAQLCQEALDVGLSAYDAIIKGMAKGMEIVGQKYEDGEYYLAELIMAGETMKEGLTVLEPHLKGGEMASAGKCIIGTVKGDLHDIGKNVFVSLLKAENYEVIDLGVDATPQMFLEAYQEHKPDIIAMSALLTTTMEVMENVITELRNAAIRDEVKVIIGGAPITDEYAEKIGADAAARDAVDGVRIIRQWGT